jgi:YD repeat-containing protein
VGNLASLKDGRSQATHYTYDKLNRRQSRQNPLGQSVSYT